MRGLYVHVPFCASKCSYCDFYSLAGRADCRESYVAAILRESLSYIGLSFQTMYIGGGTPSVLGPDLLDRLIAGLRSNFDLTDTIEATIEANPDSATFELLQVAARNGITRLSLGVQSLSDAELNSVGRAHTAAQAVTAIKVAKNLGFKRLSADLIAGLPGQTWLSLTKSLETLLELGIDHLSLYCLSIEDGTPLARNIPDNLPSDDAQVELFEKAGCLLAEHGFRHYEISNFARPGFECQHNLNYWRGGEYLGLGPAAASHIDGRRFKNQENLEAYIAEPTGQIEGAETLDITDKAAEEAMLRLRLLEEGLDADTLKVRFANAELGALLSRLDAMASAGMLVKHASHYRLNPERVLTSNPIFAEVLSP